MKTLFHNGHEAAQVEVGVHNVNEPIVVITPGPAFEEVEMAAKQAGTGFPPAIFGEPTIRVGADTDLARLVTEEWRDTVTVEG